MRKNAASNTVFPEDSEDCDFEEEVEGEMEELDCLFADLVHWALWPLQLSQSWQDHQDATRVLSPFPTSCVARQK